MILHDKTKTYLTRDGRTARFTHQMGRFYNYSIEEGPFTSHVYVHENGRYHDHAATTPEDIVAEVTA